MIDFYSKNKLPHNANKRQRYNSQWMSNECVQESNTNHMQTTKSAKDITTPRNKNKSMNLNDTFKNYIDSYLSQGLDQWEARELAKIDMKQKHNHIISPEKKPQTPQTDRMIDHLLSYQPNINDVDCW